MKRTTLVFPDTSSIAEFILGNNISNVEVSSIDQTVTAILSDEQIVAACTQHHAMLKNMFSFSVIDELDD